MMIIDTHAHVAVKSLLSRSVCAIDRKMPVLPIEDLFAQMDQHGVSHAVLVQWGMSWDHHYVARCLTDFPNRLAVVGLLDESREDACSLLEEMVCLHKFSGIRIGTTTRSPGGRSLALWEKAAELDIVVSASARQSKDFADGLEEVMRQLPKLKVRIEHMARVPYREGAPHPEFDRVLRLADYENVYCNIDGFYAHQYPDHFQESQYPFSEYAPFAKQAVEAFGADRCMWGSEFPFFNNGYDVGIRFISEACDFLGDDQRKAILGKTAQRVWGFS
jgi:predicted TIM-barrel fold metal-dependent hydrolase